MAPESYVGQAGIQQFASAKPLTRTVGCERILRSRVSCSPADASDSLHRAIPDHLGMPWENTTIVKSPANSSTKLRERTHHAIEAKSRQSTLVNPLLIENQSPIYPIWCPTWLWCRPRFLQTPPFSPLSRHGSGNNRPLNPCHHSSHASQPCSRC